jgi:anti-anti-sigma regulatory factor
VLKLTRAENGEVVIKLSGRMDAESVGELETLVSEGSKGRRIVLDLSDLTLVDQDAVSFLKRCEADNISSRIAQRISASGSRDLEAEVSPERGVGARASKIWRTKE